MPLLQFLLDENVDVRIAKFLRDQGYEVFFCTKGTKNGEVIATAKKHKAVLVTLDRDFANPDIYPPAKTSGIVVLQTHPPTLENLTRALQLLLTDVKYSDLAGKLYLASLTNIETLE